MYTEADHEVHFSDSVSSEQITSVLFFSQPTLLYYFKIFIIILPLFGAEIYRELKQCWVWVCSRAGTSWEKITQNILKSHLRTAENPFDFSTLGTSWMSLYNVIPIWLLYLSTFSFPGGSDSKESACNAGDLGLIPGLGRSLGEGNSYPLQYSCLENSMDRGAWQATVHGVAKNWTWLSDLHLSKRMVNM